MSTKKIQYAFRRYHLSHGVTEKGKVKMEILETARGCVYRIEKGMNNYGQWETTVYDDRNRVVKRETYNSAWDMEGAYAPMTQWTRLSF